MKSLLLKLGAAVGIDSAIINVITARLWSLLAGPISIFLIAHRLSSQEQGFYYTFGSVLGMVVFLELGLIYVLLQVASHEMIGLRWEDQRLVGDPINHARFADLLRKTVRWYAIVSALVLAVVLPVGLWFLGRDQAASAAVAWKGPWIFLTITCACSLSICPVTAIIEGSGRVAEVSRIRMWEGMAMGISLWIGLLSGCHLYAAPLASTASFLVTLTWLLTTKRRFLAELLFRAPGATIEWRREIVPMQWRTAVSQVSMYFAYQFFTPTIFATHGAALAGRLGMTLSLITVVAAVSLAWMQTKSAPFGKLVAQKNWAQLDAAYGRTFIQVMGVFAFGCIGLVIAMEALRWLQHPIAARLLDLPTTLIFMVGSALVQVVACRSVYLRAYKDEPFYGLQLANGVFVGLILIFLTPRVSLQMVALAYLLGACLPVLIVSSFIFQNYRKRHNTPAG